MMGKTVKIVGIQRRELMKKLMTMMLGLSLLTGAVSFAFGQETTKSEKKKKGKKKKSEGETKKETR